MSKPSPLALLTSLVATLFAGCAAERVEIPEHLAARLPDLPSHPDVPAHPDLVVGRAIVIDAPPERVWEVLADVERWPEWDPGVDVARFLEGDTLDEGARFFMDPGGYDVEAVVLDAEPGRFVRWRGAPPAGDGIVGVHTYFLLPDGDERTAVVSREAFFAWYLRPIGWLGDAGIGDGFEKALAALKSRVEERER